jgi:hypothetical protein
MSTINIDLADYHRQSNRAHYTCGHFADFRVGPPPDVGQWMLCATCYEDTEVERIEKHVTVTRPHGDQEPEFDDRVSILAQ